jgi:hypothetical protein
MTDTKTGDEVLGLEGTLLSQSPLERQVLGFRLGGTLTGHEHAFYVEPDDFIARVQRPTWTTPVADEIERLACLPEGWDSYGARPLQFKAALLGVELLTGLCNGGIPRPHMSVTPDGGLQAEWSRDQRDVVLEITPDAEITASVVDGEAINQWSSAMVDERLQQAISRLLDG